jgi:hypothetical protein
MLQHHRRAIERWAEYASTRPEHLAVIVAGSIGKGFERPDSDVDGFVVVTPSEWERRREAGDLTFFSTELCDYEGGYVDAKYVTVDFLEAAATRGSEPARSAFVGATVPWSRIEGLEPLIARIVTYPEADRTDKMLRFLAQITAAQWYVGEGERRDDRYLAAWGAQRLVLFGCRLLLAHNRVLFPYHKWLLRTMAELPERPEELLELADRLIAEPTAAHASEFAASIFFFREWPQAPRAWSTQFMLDSEWNWLEHEAPIEDL